MAASKLGFSLLFMINCCVLTPTPTLGSECEDAKILKNQNFRNAFYVPDVAVEVLHCDMALDSGWYRFVSPAGGTIPTTCVEIYHCGTKHPGWMIGNIPPVKSGIVNRTMCITGSFFNCNECLDDEHLCCSQLYQIQVRNCSSVEEFVVYHLPRITSCPIGYCAGNRKPCPAGQTSFTGFPPGCNDKVSMYNGTVKVSSHVGSRPNVSSYPVTSDKLENLIRKNLTKNGKKEIQFHCNIPHDNSDGFADLFFNVRWLINDQEVTFEELGYGVHVSVLHEYHWVNRTGPIIALPFNVHCEVMAHFNKTGRPTEWIKSSPFWAGLEVTNDHMEIREGTEVVVQFAATIPLIGVNCNPKKKECEIVFHIQTLEKAEENPQTCVTGFEPKIIAATYDCSPKFMASTYIGEPDFMWNKNVHGKFNVSIMASVDGQNVMNRKATLKLSTNVPNPDAITRYSDATHPAWLRHVVADVSLTIKDRDKNETSNHICSSKNDPHFTTFEGRAYDSHPEGEYILYKNTKYPFEVHALFQRCYHSPTCNCGVVVRSATDIFVIESCRKKNSEISHSGKGPRQGLKISQKGSCSPYGRGTKLLQKNDGNTIQVHMPSGTVVEIRQDRSYAGFMNVFITPSLVDVNNTIGMCGSLNGNMSDDLHYVDEETNLVLTNLDEKEFTRKWKVPTSESFLSVNSTFLANFELYENQQYCTCNGTRIECSALEFVNVCDNNEQAKDMTDKHLSQCRRRRETTFHDFVDDEENLEFDFDPNFDPPLKTFPTANGTTYEEASRFCENYIYNATVSKACKGIAKIDFPDLVRNCIEDIKLSDGTGWASTNIGVIQNQCSTTIQKSPSLWVPADTTGTSSGHAATLKLPSLITDTLCPVNCNEHGTCKEAVCYCEEGYIGSDCTIEKSKPPSVYSLPQQGLCDIRRRPCEGTPVYGDSFVDSDNLTCHLDYLQIGLDGSKTFTGEKATTKAELETFNEIFCLLPKSRVRRSIEGKYSTGIPVSGYEVGVSNDGTTVSEKVTFVSYDALCISCNASAYCTKKNNTCLIGGFCYSPGDTNPSNACEICSVTISDNTWTLKYNQSCLIQGQCFQDGEVNPANDCELCSAKNNSGDWTKKHGYSCLIDGRCFKDGARNPVNTCEICSSQTQDQNWTRDKFSYGCTFTTAVPTTTDSSVQSEVTSTENSMHSTPPVETTEAVELMREELSPTNIGLISGACAVLVVIVVTAAACGVAKSKKSGLVVICSNPQDFQYRNASGGSDLSRPSTVGSDFCPSDTRPVSPSEVVEV